MKALLMCVFAVAALIFTFPSSADAARIVIHNHYHRTVGLVPTVQTVAPVAVSVAPTPPPASAPVVTDITAPAPVVAAAPVMVYSSPMVILARPRPTPGTVTVDPSSTVRPGDMRRAHKLAKHGHNVQIN